MQKVILQNPDSQNPDALKSEHLKNQDTLESGRLQIQWRQNPEFKNLDELTTKTWWKWYNMKSYY